MSPTLAKRQTRRFRKEAARPLANPETRRFVVVSPKGRVFLICSGCRHWIRRRYVIQCACCMAHAENPNAATAAESEI